MFHRISQQTYRELHGLGTGSTELSGDDNFTTLGAALHDETENTVAGPTDGETVEELVAERLALSDGGETAVLDLGGIEGNGVLGELETLLDERGELTDAATLLSENLLGVGGTDDYEKTRASVSNHNSSATLPFVPAFFLVFLQSDSFALLPLFPSKRSRGNEKRANVLMSVTVGVTRTSTPE
jgi:hypothetical protein